MSLSRILFLMLFVSLAANVFAQTAKSPTESKDKIERAKLELNDKAFALVSKIADDTSILKLSENRALIYAMSGDLLWQKDKKRSRALFRRATDEVLQSQNAPKDNKDVEVGYFEMFNSPRRTVLQIIAKRDADLALELLVSSRSPELAAAVAKAQNSVQPKPTQNESILVSGFDRDKYNVGQELQLERNFTTLSAQQNPAKAVKIIKDSIARGITSELISSLSLLMKKDAETANDLTDDVLNKLANSDLSEQAENQAAFAFLNYFVNKKTSGKNELKAKPETLKKLAENVATSILQSKTGKLENYYKSMMIIPTLEKLAPEKATLVKQKQAAAKKSFPAEITQFDNLAILADKNATPEKIVAEAAKMPERMRGEMYQQATQKLIYNGNFDAAKKLLANVPAGKERDDALSYIDSQIAAKSVKDGKLDEARNQIAKLPKNQKLEQTITLAIAFHQKNTKEDHETALNLLHDVNNLLNNDEDEADFSETLRNNLKLIAGYAVIEPNQAFTMLEPLVNQTNDLLSAAALISKYDKNSSIFRNGELRVNNGLSQIRGGLSEFSKQLSLLAAADFGRTSALADGFQRDDARILARLLIAQSILDEKADSENIVIGSMSGGFIFGDVN